MSGLDFRVKASITWVPVLEKFPRPYLPVLVSIDDVGTAMVGYCDGKEWHHAGSSIAIRGHVHAWAEMPLGLEP